VIFIFAFPPPVTYLMVLPLLWPHLLAPPNYGPTYSNYGPT
jgi:hypothetical protein